MDINTILSSEKISQKEMNVIAKAFWNLTEIYNLKHDEICLLLGRESIDYKTVKKLRENNSLPDGVDHLVRAIHILGIHNSLRTIYSKNPSIVYSWFKTKDVDLSNLSPIELVKKSGLKSLSAIIFLRNRLDYRRSAL